MTETFRSLAPVLPYAAAALLLAAAWLVWGGLRGRRVGDEKRCGHCGYIVDNLTSEQCPECGRRLTPRSVVRGVRRRHCGRLALGTVLLLATTAGGVVWARGAWQQFRWYDYAPTWWVERDLSHGDPKNIDEAWDELVRRRPDPMKPEHVPAVMDQCLLLLESATASNLGHYWPISAAAGFLEEHGKTYPLSPVQSDRIVRLMLREQSKQPKPLRIDLWRELGPLFVEAMEQNRLTPAQREQFYQAATRAVLRADDRVLQGDALTVWISQSGSGPLTDRLYQRVQVETITVNGKPYERERYMSSLANFGHGASGVELDTGRLSPGKQDVRIVVTKTIHAGIDPNLPALWQDRSELSTSFELLPADADDGLRLVPAPELAAAIRAAITIKSFEVLGNGRAQLFVASGRLPKNVAFDVFVVEGGREHRLTDVAFSGRSTTVLRGEKVPLPPGPTIDLVFRTSRKAAREAAMEGELWDGTIRFDAVPISRP
jgi:hypothetical protein